MAKTYTTNFNFVKFDQGDLEWDADVNENFDTIDEKIHDPESHTHVALNLDYLKMNEAHNKFGAISFTNVTEANADATYGTEERDLLNALKSKLNLLLDTLRTSTGCGVLRWETSTTSTTSTTTTTTTTTTV